MRSAASSNSRDSMRSMLSSVLGSLQRVKNMMRAYIGGVDQAPDFTLDNEYITRGYRINHNSNTEIAQSLCTCHNQTVNVWSHCFGVYMFILLFVGLLIWVVPSQLRYANELL